MQSRGDQQLRLLSDRPHEPQIDPNMGPTWGHFGVILESSWGHLGIILESFWSHLGVILGSSWGHIGVMLGSYWGHLGVILVSSWGHLGVILGWSWGHLGVSLGSVWDQFGITLGSLWGHFGTVLVLTFFTKMSRSRFGLQSQDLGPSPGAKRPAFRALPVPTVSGPIKGAGGRGRSP